MLVDNPKNGGFFPGVAGFKGNATSSATAEGSGHASAQAVVFSGASSSPAPLVPLIKFQLAMDFKAGLPVRFRTVDARWPPPL